jgi:Mrp family chromosome partitioning ATPase
VVPAASERLDEPGGPQLRQEMLLLHQSVDVLLADVDRRVVHFTAGRRREGTSTIVRAYGRALAEAAGRSVLILDANEAHPEQHLHFGVSGDIGWDDIAADGASIERAIQPTSCANLSIAPFSRRAPLKRLLDGGAVAQVFARLREQFDTILVDSSPVLRPGAMAVAGKADGVVLVVDAERTRWPIALSAKETIERSGGTVLGVVLNRRRYPIPESIYRWL